MDNQQGATLQHVELCSMLCGSLDGSGVWGRMDTCMCMAESLCCSSETVTTLLIGYIPKQNVFGVKIKINSKRCIKRKKDFKNGPNQKPRKKETISEP